MDKTLENTTVATPWGEGRIAFMAHRESIESLIQQGWPLAKIYKHFQDKLAGLSYSGFTRCIRNYTETPAAPKKSSSVQSASIPEKPTIVSVVEAPISSVKESFPKPFFQKGDRVPDIEKLI